MNEEISSENSNERMRQEAKAVTEIEWLEFSFVTVTLTLFLIYLFIPLIISIFTPPQTEVTSEIDGVQMVVSLIISQAPAMIILTLIALLFYTELPIKDKFRLKNWRWYYLAIPFGLEVVILPTIWIVTSIFAISVKIFFDIELPARELQTFLMDCETITLIPVFISAVFIAPVIEELIFRKIIFDFAEKHIGTISSLIVTSVMFTTIHFTVVQSPALFIIAVALQILYIKFKSIYPCILFHMVHNGTTFLILILLRYLAQHEQFKYLLEGGV